MRPAGRVVAALVPLLLLALPLPAALGQDASDGSTPEARPESPGRPAGVALSATVGASLQSRADIDDGGDFAVSRRSVSVGGGGRWDGVGPFSLRVSVEELDFDFDRAFEPWSRVRTVQVGATVRHRADENWMIVGGPLVRSSGETGAAFGSTLTGGLFAVASTEAREGLRLGVGFAAMSRIEEHPLVIPLLSLDWGIADDTTVRLGAVDAGSGGAGLEVAWEANESWTVAGGVQFQRSRFRLDDTGPVPDGVGEESSTRLFARSRWKVNSAVSVEAFAGVVLGGRLRLEDRRGRDLVTSGYDTATVIGLSVDLDF